MNTNLFEKLLAVFCTMFGYNSQFWCTRGKNCSDVRLALIPSPLQSAAETDKERPELTKLPGASASSSVSSPQTAAHRLNRQTDGQTRWVPLSCLTCARQRVRQKSGQTESPSTPAHKVTHSPELVFAFVSRHLMGTMCDCCWVFGIRQSRLGTRRRKMRSAASVYAT